MPDKTLGAAGRDAEAERRRVFSVACVLILLSVVGFFLAYVFQWPSDFVLAAEPDSEVTVADIVDGTVTSIPLAPFLVLVLCALVVRSRRWWGTVATVVLTLLGGVFIMGGLAEITSKNANVPKPVLLIAGGVYAALGLTLLISGALAVLAERRTRMRS